MNKKLLEKFRKLLLAERDSVLKHLMNLKGSSEQELEQESGDEVDIASNEITANALQKLGTREQKHLSKIETALQKIEEGSYGTCEECGEEISPARLEARPVALFCIDCKTLQETRERQYVDESQREEDPWESSEAEETLE
jgi:DnaK suppressor protein